MTFWNKFILIPRQLTSVFLKRTKSQAKFKGTDKDQAECSQDPTAGEDLF